LICNSTALNKYIDKSPQVFFIFGSEIILKNNASKFINNIFAERGFTEKKVVTSSDYQNIEQIIHENAGGSLFGSKTIIEVIHEGGKISKDILNIFEMRNIEKFENLVIIVRSSIEKLNKSLKWVKQVDKCSLIVECSKLKSFEEKNWVLNQLDFIDEGHAKEFADKITDLYAGNLIAQYNEINILRLTYTPGQSFEKNNTDDSEFLPFQLEDKIIELDTKYCIRIINSIKKNDDHYAQLLVWIVGKIINTSVYGHQNKYNFEKIGVWKNKIPSYKNFVRFNTLQRILPLQKKVYQLDLASKGLGGIKKDQFWQELENIVINLTSN